MLLRLRRLFEAHGRLICLLLWCLGWVAVATLSLTPLSVPAAPAGADKGAHLLA